MDKKITLRNSRKYVEQYNLAKTIYASHHDMSTVETYIRMAKESIRKKGYAITNIGVYAIFCSITGDYHLDSIIETARKVSTDDLIKEVLAKNDIFTISSFTNN